MRLAITEVVTVNASQETQRCVTWYDAEIGTAGDDRSSIPLCVATLARLDLTGTDRRDLVADFFAAEGWAFADRNGISLDKALFAESARQAKGAGLLYIVDVMFFADCRPGTDFALVRHVCDVVGSNCALAVMRFDSEECARHWTDMGFIVDTAQRKQGFMHLSLGCPP